MLNNFSPSRSNVTLQTYEPVSTLDNSVVVFISKNLKCLSEVPAPDTNIFFLTGFQANAFIAALC